MTIINTTIQNRRIDVPAPWDLPDGTEIVITIERPECDNDPLPPEEIARVLAAMRQLEPLDIPSDVAADLEEWERRANQHGIDRADLGLEEAFG